MKFKFTLLILMVLAIFGAALYLRYGGVTHERIVDVVEDRAHEITGRIDERYGELDHKLDRIESKLDRILELADRPLPDGM